VEFEGGTENVVLMRVVEIGGKNHVAEHPSLKPESAVVDALADALLRVRSPSMH
jgi:hypothetical protein